MDINLFPLRAVGGEGIFAFLNAVISAAFLLLAISAVVANGANAQNFATKSTGDELDLMFSAAIRKDCKVALYVTNGDLTPQAKRYINDQEYLRGSSIDPALLPHTEYWTGRKIWERIASNSQILNKWFSGAAQVHGLRSVSLSLVISEMPERAVRESEPEAVLKTFQALGSSFYSDRGFLV
jgi:hypothetical protein